MHMLTTIKVEWVSANLSVEVVQKSVFTSHFMLHIGYKSFRKGAVKIFVLHADPRHIVQCITGIVFKDSSVKNTWHEPPCIKNTWGLSRYTVVTAGLM